MAKNDIITCTTCGSPVAKSAKACPSCGAKPKKPFSKTFNGKLLKLIILLYVVISVDFVINNRTLPAGFLNSTDEPTTESSTDITDTNFDNSMDIPVENTDNANEFPVEEPIIEQQAIPNETLVTQPEIPQNTEVQPETNSDGTVEPVKLQ